MLVTSTINVGLTTAFRPGTNVAIYAELAVRYAIEPDGIRFYCLHARVT